MKTWNLVVSLLCVLCAFVVTPSSAEADTWSQTTFTDGTFSNTITTTGATDVNLQPKTADYSGTGADGLLTVSSLFNINTQTNGYNGRIEADAWASRVSGLTANTATLVTTPPAGALNINDEIILISVKGSSSAYGNVGRYEFLRIRSIAGNVVTFAWNKTRYYGEGTDTNDTNVGTTQFVILQRVPNYTNVTVNWGITMTCNAWNGTTGGVLAFRANGTVQVGSTTTGKSDSANRYAYISAGYKGCRGGTGAVCNVNAQAGETYFGGLYNSGGTATTASATNGVASPNPGGGGGGGGDTNANTTIYTGSSGTTGCAGGGGGGGYYSVSTYNASGGGGGGGGYGGVGSGGAGNTYGGNGSGGTGGTGSNCPASDGGAWQRGGGGGGGGIYGDSTQLGNRAYFGAGGGAGGGAYWNGQSLSGANGGASGGIIFIGANTVNVFYDTFSTFYDYGYIVADGERPPPPSPGTAVPGGGGGGAGGSIVIRANSINNEWVSGITANGGAGGTGYPGGAGGGGRIYAQFNSGPSNDPTPNYSAGGVPAESYSWPDYSTGIYVSPMISPSLISWGVLTYTITSPTNTTLTIDVLKSDNSVIASNVTSGTNLGNIIKGTNMCYAIKLRANFSTTDNTQTPTLSDWGINYTGGGVTVTTTNWTGLIPSGTSVQMGQSIAQAKFDMKTTGGVAFWKRFRIDKGVGIYANIACPDNKIEVQIWCENTGNGFWDIGDTLISKGNFTNGTCYLNMNRWQVTTTPKTYYIIYKLANDIGGGQRAGVKIVDSSYLEFENATCVGVPP